MKNLFIDELYFQLNFIDGFGLLDNRGQIIKGYIENSEKARYAENLNIISIHNFDDNVLQIEHTTEKLWVKFRTEDLKQVCNLLEYPIDTAENLIGAEKGKRIALRGKYVYRTNRRSQLKDILNKFYVIDGLKPQRLTFNHTKGDIISTITVEEVVNKVDKTDFGLMFDIDVYIQKDFAYNEAKTRLKLLLEFIEKDMYGLIERVISQ